MLRLTNYPIQYPPECNDPYRSECQCKGYFPIGQSEIKQYLKNKECDRDCTSLDTKFKRSLEEGEVFRSVNVICGVLPLSIDICLLYECGEGLDGINM